MYWFLPQIRYEWFRENHFRTFPLMQRGLHPWQFRGQVSFWPLMEAFFIISYRFSVPPLCVGNGLVIGVSQGEAHRGLPTERTPCSRGHDMPLSISFLTVNGPQEGYRTLLCPFLASRYELKHNKSALSAPRLQWEFNRHVRYSQGSMLRSFRTENLEEEVEHAPVTATLLACQRGRVVKESWRSMFGNDPWFSPHAPNSPDSALSGARWTHLESYLHDRERHLAVSGIFLWFYPFILSIQRD